MDEWIDKCIKFNKPKESYKSYFEDFYYFHQCNYFGDVDEKH